MTHTVSNYLTASCFHATSCIRTPRLGPPNAPPTLQMQVRVSWDTVVTMDFLATVMDVLKVQRPAAQVRDLLSMLLREHAE